MGDGICLEKRLPGLPGFGKNRASLSFQSKFGANGCAEERSVKSKNTLCVKAFCNKVLRQNDRYRIRGKFLKVLCI